MHPSLLVLAEDLDPDMIFAVPYPSYSCTKSSAEHTKAIRELADSPFSSS